MTNCYQEYDEHGVTVEWSQVDQHEINESHERDFWTEDDQEESEDFFL